MAVTEATAQGLIGTIQCTVTIRQDDEPLHKARVLLIRLGRTVETADDGTFRFEQVPPGTYDIVVNAPALSAARQTVNVTAGQPVIANFQMDLAPVQERITVTAGGREETSLTSFQSTAVVDSIQLVEDSKASLGEVLEGQPGVAKRSFGPGNSRPVIRGFDGDRVAVLKDGIPTGTLSSQSGDHGETLDTLSLDRVEIVKGPATLLYGANAIGGVVNAITPASEIHDHPHAGVTGSLTGIGGTTNDLGGGSGAIQYGTGNWLLSGDFGGQRTASYHTPVGEVFNSQTRTLNGSGGIGRYTEKSFLGLRLGAESARYGIPAAHGEEAEEGEEHEVVFLPLRRYNGRFTGGRQNPTHLCRVFAPYSTTATTIMRNAPKRRYTQRLTISSFLIAAFSISARPAAWAEASASPVCIAITRRLGKSPSHRQ
jgi:iron complex outermembrane receptor protein